MSPAASSDIDPEREVRRIHVMLEDWYGGIRDQVDPFEKSLATDFTAIGPDGAIRTRTETLDAYAAERAEYAAAGVPVAIELEEIEHRRARNRLHLLTYVKRIQAGDAVEARSCSVWLRETDRAPTGLQWLHLQETPRTVTEDADDPA